MLDAMARSALINVRIDPEDKKALEAAARTRGLTLSSFIVRTLLAEVQKEPRRGRARGNVPAMFRTACEEAKRGGAFGYVLPGRLLIEHALGTDAEEGLAEIVFDESTPAILAWCEAHFPECLALVPDRRREHFATGLIEAYQQMEDEQDARLLG